MTPELWSKVLEAGIAVSIVGIVVGFLALLVKMCQPMLAQMTAGFETAQKYSEASHKGLELLTDRIQRALEREEASNDLLRQQVIEYTRLIARLETEHEELKRLRELDQKRIKELEDQQMLDRQAIEDMRRQLQTRTIEMDLLNQELEKVKRERAKVAEERDAHAEEIKALRGQLDELTTRVTAQEEASTKTNGSEGAPPPGAASPEDKESEPNETKAS